MGEVDYLGSPRDARQGPTPADDLAVSGQVRDDAEVLLGAAVGEAETGDDLIKDEQRLGAVAQFTETRQKARLWADDPLHRLDDDRRELPGVILHDALHRIEIVVGSDQHRFGKRVWDTGRVGDPSGVAGWHPRDNGIRRVVVVAVEADFELEDLRTPREGSGHAQGVEGGLGAGGAEHHSFGAWDCGYELCGQLDRHVTESSVMVDRTGGLSPHGLDHCRVLVAQDERSGAAHVIEVLGSLDVDNATSARRGDRHPQTFRQEPRARRTAGERRLGELLVLGLVAPRHVSTRP